MSNKRAKKVLLIGWDAADWKVMNPLMDAGQMPTLEKLVNGGVMGNITTLDPPISPMLWTSIGTGMRPYKHGISGFTEPDPAGNQIRPVSVTSRKVKALWNILGQQGLKTHVVGWWPSHPAEPINGIYVSNNFQLADQPYGHHWPMPTGTIHPVNRTEEFAELRVHPGEITAEHLLPFVPEASMINQDEDDRLANIAKLLGHTASLHNCATHILENEEWDFMAVYFDAIDHFSHGFMHFHPPQLPDTSDHLFNLYKDVVNSAYRYHDMMLERLLQLAGEDTTVMIGSDHGFHSDHLRPKAIPNYQAGPTHEHSPYGMVVMNGNGIKKDAQLFGASILDVTPTILSMFGLPVGEDMDGTVLANAFESQPQIETIESWEKIEGDCGMHPEELREDPIEARAALDQLVALGYIDKPDEDTNKALSDCVYENQFYMARAYMDAGKMHDAVKLLKPLFDDNAEVARYGLYYAKALQTVGDIKECRRVADLIAPKSEEDKRTPSMNMLEGSLLLSEKKPETALKYFQKALDASPSALGVHLQIGIGFMNLELWDKAIAAFDQELLLDAESAVAFQNKGICMIRLNREKEGLEMLLESVGLQYNNAVAHYFLGIAFHQNNYRENAIQSFEVALRMEPGLNRAKQWLVKLSATNSTTAKERVWQMKSELKEHYQGSANLITGLPESGIKELAQWLNQCGFQIRNLKEEMAKSNTGDLHTFFKKRQSEHVIWTIPHNWMPSLPHEFEFRVIAVKRKKEEAVMVTRDRLEKEGRIPKGVMPFSLYKNYDKTQNNLLHELEYKFPFEFMEIAYTGNATTCKKHVKQITNYFKIEQNSAAA